MAKTPNKLNKQKTKQKIKKKVTKKRVTKKKTTKSNNISPIKKSNLPKINKKGIPVSSSVETFNFWTTLFNNHYFRQKYVSGKKDKYIFATLTVYKSPKDNVRADITFHFNGVVTINRLDKGDRDSIVRLPVNEDDKILFSQNVSGVGKPTMIDYIPKYQQDMMENDPEHDFRVISDGRIKNVRHIFSWLENESTPEHMKQIIERVEILKGLKIKKKEDFNLLNTNNNNLLLKNSKLSNSL